MRKRLGGGRDCVEGGSKSDEAGSKAVTKTHVARSKALAAESWTICRWSTGDGGEEGWNCGLQALGQDACYHHASKWDSG